MAIEGVPGGAANVAESLFAGRHPVLHGDVPDRRASFHGNRGQLPDEAIVALIDHDALRIRFSLFVIVCFSVCTIKCFYFDMEYCIDTSTGWPVSFAAKLGDIIGHFQYHSTKY